MKLWTNFKIAQVHLGGKLKESTAVLIDQLRGMGSQWLSYGHETYKRRKSAESVARHYRLIGNSQQNGTCIRKCKTQQ